ncbi:hypothetical protein [Caulobacter sp. NIBR2454]|uniref:hypothetical protein n=1 Tax=Caulobacter sp. NIBR2454 TaxID=3015996 RepID=UPI0022B613CA|nr:hypothetical protein [Caulobacter sp. NIBR2454]
MKRAGTIFGASVAVAGILALGGCERERTAAWSAQAPAPPPDAAEAAYMAPPTVLTVERAGDNLRLSGKAAPGARVRMGAPTGETLFATANADGGWSVVAPRGDGPRLFGLSMMLDDRTVQAEGYVLVTPTGQAAILRAGAGANVIAGAGTRPQILALDYDQEGGAVVSGLAVPDTPLEIRVDGITRGQGEADSQGRFTLPLSRPLDPGSYQIVAAGQGGEDTSLLSMQAVAPLTAGPFQGAREANGWRIDWMTPAGGVQTTIVMEAGA